MTSAERLGEGNHQIEQTEHCSNTVLKMNDFRFRMQMQMPQILEILK